MIIEGRHADVGSGIFISDIQRESVAEEVNRLSFVFSCKRFRIINLIHSKSFAFIAEIVKAGLAVGDMILCVNKDELLGADYDTVNELD